MYMYVCMRVPRACVSQSEVQPILNIVNGCNGVMLANGAMALQSGHRVSYHARICEVVHQYLLLLPIIMQLVQLVMKIFHPTFSCYKKPCMNIASQLSPPFKYTNTYCAISGHFCYDRVSVYSVSIGSDENTGLKEQF